MSERQPHNQEVQRQHQEIEHNREHDDRLRNKLEHEAREADKTSTQEQLEQAAKRVESLAQSNETHKLNQEDSKEQHPTSQSYAGEQKVSFTRTMTRVRKRLNIVEKPLSKVIHNPLVDKASEVAGQTVARPSSMLGGAFFALLGTSALLWITNHYGYEYNYLAVILLFGIGMVAGIAIEGVIASRKRLK